MAFLCQRGQGQQREGQQQAQGVRVAEQREAGRQGQEPPVPMGIQAAEDRQQQQAQPDSGLECDNLETF